MSFLMQATAVAVAADPLGGHLVQAAVALILALQAWLIRAVTAMRDDMRTIRQTLFGVNNDNGIDGDVKNLKGRVAECEGYITRTVPERLKLWEGFKTETEASVENAERRIDKHEHRFKAVEQATLLLQNQVNDIDAFVERRKGPSDRRQT